MNKIIYAKTGIDKKIKGKILTKEHICYCCEYWLCTDDVLELSVNVKDFWGICRIKGKDTKGGDCCTTNFRMRNWKVY